MGRVSWHFWRCLFFALALAQIALGCQGGKFSGKSTHVNPGPPKPAADATPPPPAAPAPVPEVPVKDDVEEVTPVLEVETEEEVVACAKRKMLIYSLQPAGSSAAYEKYGESLATALAKSGFSAEFSNRQKSPTLDAALFKKFDLVMFISGCGGAVGAPSAVEMGSIKDYFLGGGSLAVVTDDDQGDSSAPGSCHARVNPIANNFGVSFSGFEDNRGHGCDEVEALDPLLKGIKLGRSTSAIMTLTGKGALGNTEPELIGRLKTGSAAEALIRSDGKHGAALFSPDFGSIGCDAVKYLSNIVTHLGCKE